MPCGWQVRTTGVVRYSRNNIRVRMYTLQYAQTD